MGGVAAATGNAAPADLALIDPIYSAILGAAVVFAGGRSRRYAWLATSVAAVWLAPDLPLRVLAIAAVALTMYALATERRRWMGALVGLAVVMVLARLGTGPFHGSTTLLAALAVVPITVSALRRLPEGRIRTITAVVTTTAAAATLATIIFGIAAVLSLGDVTTAVDEATDGLDLASDGDQDGAAEALGRAEDAFASARGRVGGVWSAPARLVPIVGQHVKAVQVATSEGVSLTATAAEAATTVDIDEIRIQNGTLDLDLLDRLAPVLSRAEASIRRARDRLIDAENPWIVPPIAERLTELSTELDDALPAAETAALAVRELPALLGRDDPAHWLVLSTTPAEARGFNGLVGNYLVVEAREGRVEIVAAGRNEELNALLVEADARIDEPSQYVDRWGGFEVERLFQDVTLEPDFPSVARVAADLYEQATGLSIEGVAVADPYAIAAVLEVTGPVNAGGRRLSSSNVADFLLVEQYAAFDSETARVLALAELIANTFVAFTSGDLPGPRALAAAIGPVVEEDRLSVWWRAGGTAADLTEVTGLDGSFPEPDGHDLIGVVHQNAGQNKIDVYLERTLDYEVVVDDGDARATATVTFTNTAPSSGLPDAVIANNDQGFPLGTNVSLVHLHTALDLVSLTVDGEETPASRRAAFGAEAIGATILIPPGESVVLVYELRGRLEGPYALTVAQQALVGVETVTARATVDGETFALLTDHQLRTDITVTPGVDG